MLQKKDPSKNDQPKNKKMPIKDEIGSLLVKQTKEPAITTKADRA